MKWFVLAAATFFPACQCACGPDRIDLPEVAQVEATPDVVTSSHPLALRAVAPPRARVLTVPRGASASWPGLTFVPVELAESTQVTNGKTSLTSLELYVKVAIELHSTETQELDLRASQLINGAQIAELDAAAQRVASGSPLLLTLGSSETRTVTLYFTAPPEMIGPGLKFVLTHGGSGVELSLQ